MVEKIKPFRVKICHGCFEKGKHLKPFWRSAENHKKKLKRRSQKINNPLLCIFCKRKINLSHLKQSNLKFKD